MTDNTAIADEEVASGDEPLLKPSLTEFPWLHAAAVSLTTLVVQYLLLIVSISLTDVSVTRPGWSLWNKAVQYVFILYSSHHVPIATTVSEGVQVGARLQNLLYGQSLFPVALFFSLPIVTLVVAGYLFERNRQPSSTVELLEESAMVGTGFAIPYVLAGALGSFVFVRRISREAAQAASAPALLWAIVAMFLFPMVFVTIGAAVAYRQTADQA